MPEVVNATTHAACVMIGEKAADLLLASSMFPAAAPTARPRAPFLKVECLGGSRWAFDEVGQPEDVLMREASAFAKGSHGVIGGARMKRGRSVLLVEWPERAGEALGRADIAIRLAHEGSGRRISIVAVGDGGSGWLAASRASLEECSVSR